MSDTPTPQVSIVLPVYNESGHLVDEINRIRSAMDVSDYSYEIIVVDDASTDGSLEIALDLEGVRVVAFTHNRGAGAARKLGTEVAQGDVVVWTDVDMSYPNGEIPRLVKELDGYDQVVGARMSEEGTHKVARVPAKWAIRRLAQYLSQTEIPDLNSGFRAFRRDVAGQFLHLLPDGFSHVTTLTMAFLSNGYSVEYIDIEYAPRAGESKFHWYDDTKQYLQQLTRMVMMWNPLRVLGPLATVLFLIGGAKLIFDIFDKSFRLGTNTLLVFFAAMAVFVIALLADLIVQVTKPVHAVMPASIIVDPDTDAPPGTTTLRSEPPQRRPESESADDFIVFGRPDIHQVDIDEVVDTLRSGWIGTGPKTAKLEEQFASYTDAAHAVATNSCTAAMHLALVALGIGEGDEVVLPTMTFPATANVVVHAGATPVLTDVDPQTRTIDADHFAPAITERTKAALPVHFAGYPVEVDALRTATSGQPLTIIADAAHAIETRHGGNPVGSLTDISAFSFYATKNITTGEGGMLTTNDAEFADRIRRLRLHGLSADAWNRYSKGAARPYVSMEPGFKYNLSDLQAALALHQLERIERSLERRHQIWDRYDEAFADLPVELPMRPAAAGDRSALHLYAPLLDTDVVPLTRDEFRSEMHARGIGTGIHFIAVHLHPYFRDRLGFKLGMFPNSERISERTVSLPMAAGLADTEVERIIDAVRSILGPYT